jgi:hypothetical protein
MGGEVFGGERAGDGLNLEEAEGEKKRGEPSGGKTGVVS